MLQNFSHKFQNQNNNLKNQADLKDFVVKRTLCVLFFIFPTPTFRSKAAHFKRIK